MFYHNILLLISRHSPVPNICDKPISANWFIIQALVDITTTWVSAGCIVGRLAEQTAAPDLSFLGGCSSGRALSDRMSSKQMPGKCSFLLSVCTGTNLKKDGKIFHQTDNNSNRVWHCIVLCCHIIHLVWNITQGTHVSISSLQWGVPSPPQRFLTPTSWKSLSERSSTFSLLEAELITEARTSELFSVRLQLLSLNEQKIKENAKNHTLGRRG